MDSFNRWIQLFKKYISWSLFGCLFYLPTDIALNYLMRYPLAIKNLITNQSWSLKRCLELGPTAQANRPSQDRLGHQISMTSSVIRKYKSRRASVIATLPLYEGLRLLKSKDRNIICPREHSNMFYSLNTRIGTMHIKCLDFENLKQSTWNKKRSLWNLFVLFSYKINYTSLLKLTNNYQITHMLNQTEEYNTPSHQYWEVNLILEIVDVDVKQSIQTRSKLHCFNSSAQTWCGHPVRPLLLLSPFDGQIMAPLLDSSLAS